MKKIILFITACFLLAGITYAYAAEEPAGFVIKLDKTVLSENSSVLEVTVETDFRSPLRGIQGSISYNKNVLILESAEAGEVILDGLTGEVDTNRDGKIDFSAAYVDPTKQGGVLLKAVFKLNPDNTYTKSEIRAKNIKIVDMNNSTVSCGETYQYFNINLPEADKTPPATPQTNTTADNTSHKPKDRNNTSIIPVAGTAEKHVFSDISEHWAAADIELLFGLGIINGVSENTFEPERFITRAEFTKLVSVLLELKVAEPNVFADVPEDSWYRRYIMLAYTAGIVNGDGEVFRPQEQMTRAELAVIADRVLTYCGIEASEKTVEVFSDDEHIPSWAKENVYRIAGAGIMQGYENRFDPDGKTTRAQAAAVIRRLLKKKTN
ncbi:MAG: S-layer homology domain-containing protein [Clostridia bacterium]|nr:S-layer homology domain-containing protein [Clostridia bacterium]